MTAAQARARARLQAPVAGAEPLGADDGDGGQGGRDAARRTARGDMVDRRSEHRGAQRAGLGIGTAARPGQVGQEGVPPGADGVEVVAGGGAQRVAAQRAAELLAN
ncbi:hypothetical protein ACWDOR_45525 [Streptosporangium canum]